MTRIIIASFSSYILACVVTSSSLFEPFRSWFKTKTAGTFFDKKPKHFIECRLCVSFWTALLSVAILRLDFVLVLPIYGLSYFLATQER